MIHSIFRLGINELRLTWKDRTSAVWMVIMPFFFILFFGGVGGGGSGTPSDTTIGLGVVDADVSWISRILVETLEGEDFAVRELEPGATGDDLPARTLVIPAGLADAVARGQQVVLYLSVDPGANDAANATAEMHIFRALARVLGTLVEMQTIAGVDEPMDLQVDRVLDYRQLQQREPLVRVEQSYAGSGRAAPSGFGQAIPGMLTQFMVMIVMITGAVYLTTEKTNGVLKRLAAGPFSPRTLIAGKLTGLVMLAMVQAALLMIMGALVGGLGIFGADFYWGSSPVGLALVIVSSAVATAGLTLFVGALLATPSQASAVGWLAGMIMSGLGGCWWPLEVVPAWLRSVGHIFPTAWTMDALHKLVSFGRGTDAVLLESAVLLAYGAVFSLLGARFLRLHG